jgi:hypothetical protein
MRPLYTVAPAAPAARSVLAVAIEVGAITRLGAGANDAALAAVRSRGTCVIPNLRHVSKPAVSALQFREVWRDYVLQKELFSARAALPPPRPQQTVKYD